MNYWLLSLPRVDMEHCIAIGIFGMNRKYCLGRVAKGDKVGCYVTKEYKVIALGEATSDYYMDVTKVFRQEGLFPDRFNFTAKALSKEIDFMQVLDDMSFVKNRAYWSVYLRSAIVQISEKDWKILESRK